MKEKIKVFFYEVNSRGKKFLRVTRPVPESLQFLWSARPEEGPIGLNDPTEKLYKHYLRVDGLHGQEAYKTEFQAVYQVYRLVSIGLKVGAVPYKIAREHLHEALASRNPHLTDIYLFWRQAVADFIQKGNNLAVTEMEAKSDIVSIERRIIDDIASHHNLLLRAYYIALLAGDGTSFFQNQHRANMRLLMKTLFQVLPKPEDFSRAHPRSDLQLPQFKARGYVPHDNDAYHLFCLEWAARKIDGGAEFRQIQKYFLDIIRSYDPKVGSPYVTARLLRLSSRMDYIPEDVRDRFLRRTMKAVSTFTAGTNEQETLLEAIIAAKVEAGDIKSAYKVLLYMKNPLRALDAIGPLLEWEVKNGDIRNIEQVYNFVVASLVGKKWRGYGLKIGEHKTHDDDLERDMWLLHWVLTGWQMAEDGNYSIFSLPEVVRYIQSGRVDSQLFLLVQVCEQKPDSESLNRLIINRIQELLQKENEGEKLENGYVNSRGTHEALEALLILRSKGII